MRNRHLPGTPLTLAAPPARARTPRWPPSVTTSKPARSPATRTSSVQKPAGFGKTVSFDQRLCKVVARAQAGGGRGELAALTLSLAPDKAIAQLLQHSVDERALPTPRRAGHKQMQGLWHGRLAVAT